MEWTLQTLVRVVRLGALKDSTPFFSALSSTAVHNLLVLMELNIKTLPRDDVRDFLENIEQLSFVRCDQWCSFLIHCLRRCLGDTEKQSLVSMESDSVECQSESPEVVEVAVQPQQSDDDVEMKEVDTRESPVYITIPDSDELDTPPPPLSSPGHANAGSWSCTHSPSLLVKGLVSQARPIYIRLHNGSGLRD